MSLPSVPAAVAFPAPRSASVTTCTISGALIAESSRALVCAESTSAALVSVPVLETSQPAGTVRATS